MASTTYTLKAAADPTMTLGTIKSGTYSNTLTSDDSRLIFNDSGGSGAAKWKLDLNFDGVSPAVQFNDATGVIRSRLHQFDVVLEAVDALSTDNYYILLWNFITSAWDEVGAAMSIGTTEASFTRSITANKAYYINDNGEIKLRIANGKALAKVGAPDNDGELGIDSLYVTVQNDTGVTFDTHAKTNVTGAPSTDYTFNITPGAGASVMVMQGSTSGQSITQVDLDGNVSVKLNQIINSKWNQYYNPGTQVTPSVQQTVRIQSGGQDNSTWAAITFIGTPSDSTVIVSTASGTSDTSPNTQTITGADEGNMVVDGINVEGGTETSAINGGQTAIFDDFATGNVQSASYEAAPVGGGNVVVSYTFASTTSRLGALELLSAPAAAAQQKSPSGGVAYSGLFY